MALPVDAVLTSKIVHAPACLVLLANLRYFGCGELPGAAGAYAAASGGCPVPARHELQDLVVQTGQRGGLVRESFC